MRVYENRGQLGSPRANEIRAHVDLRGQEALREANENLGKSVVGGLIDLGNSQVAAGVMAANCDYNARMAELEERLMSNKEGAALDNVRLFDEGRQKILDDVIKNSKNLYGIVGKNALRQSADRDYVRQRARMERYQAAEGEKFKDNELTRQKTLMLGNIAADYGDDDAFSEALARGDSFIEARYRENGEKRVLAEQQLWRGDAIEAGVNAALNAKDFERAGDLLQLGEEYLGKERAERIVSDMNGRILTAKTVVAVNKLFYDSGGDYGLMLDVFKRDYLSPDRGEQEGQLKLFDREFDSLKRQARRAADANFERTRAGIKNILAGGVTYGQAVQEMEKLAGGDNERLAELKRNLDAEMEKGWTDLNRQDLGNVRRAIEDRMFGDKGELEEYLLKKGVRKAQREDILKIYDRYEGQKGEYAVDWNAVKAAVVNNPNDANFNKMTAQEREFAWVAMKDGVMEFVQQKLATEGRMPNRFEIISAAREFARVEKFAEYPGILFGTNDLEISTLQRLKMGLRENPRRNGDNTFVLNYMDGRSKQVSGRELEKLLKEYK